MVFRTMKREWPVGWREFRHNLAVLPYNVALALFSAWAGVGAFADQTVAARLFNDALPGVLADIFNVVYVVSGITIVLGIGWAYRNIEAFGLFLLVGVLLVRTAAVYAMFGYRPATAAAIAQSVIFGVATLARLTALIKGWSVVMLKETKVHTSVEDVIRS